MKKSYKREILIAEVESEIPSDNKLLKEVVGTLTTAVGEGWMGKVIIVNIDKKHVYLQSVYKEKDIVFIKDKVKPIEKEWFINTETPMKSTHKEFERELIKKYTFIEKVNL